MGGLQKRGIIGEIIGDRGRMDYRRKMRDGEIREIRGERERKKKQGWREKERDREHGRES